MNKFFIALIGGTVLLIGFALLVLPGPGLPIIANHRRRTGDSRDGILLGEARVAPGQGCSGSRPPQIRHQGLVEAAFFAAD